MKWVRLNCKLLETFFTKSPNWTPYLRSAILPFFISKMLCTPKFIILTGYLVSFLLIFSFFFFKINVGAFLFYLISSRMSSVNGVMNVKMGRSDSPRKCQKGVYLASVSGGPQSVLRPAFRGRKFDSYTQGLSLLSTIATQHSFLQIRKFILLTRKKSVSSM